MHALYSLSRTLSHAARRFTHAMAASRAGLAAGAFLVALVLLGTAWRQSASSGALQVTQQQLRERQHAMAILESAAAAVARKAQLNQQQDGVATAHRRQLVEAAAGGQYGGSGTYGYGSGGYGYSGGGYGTESSSSSPAGARRRLQQQAGDAPLLVYVDKHAVAAAGLAHGDGIELDAAAVRSVARALSSASEQRAARKLLLSAAAIDDAAVEQLVAPLEPVDDLLQASDVASAGSYGYGSYGGGYGSYSSGGYGNSVGHGRLLRQLAEGDDLQLYRLWAQQQQQLAH